MSWAAYPSSYFRLKPLADGVFAALSTDSRWATSNAGFVNLGDRTLVFDSFASPQAAQELRLAAEQETGHRADRTGLKDLAPNYPGSAGTGRQRV
ncbi:MAG: hypothetical protein NTU59_02755 [Coprothermobacterota bacterium]|nr:hypothetical protein [Coprothermobacterota bacterium]